MKLQAITLIALVLLVITGVSGCSIRPKASAMHDLGYPYTNTQPENIVTQKQVPITVEAPKWLEDNRIHYRLLFATPTQVRFYAMDRWIAPPSELFEQLLNNEGKVWPAPVMIQLQAFEQQFETPQKAKVILFFTAVSIPDEKQEQHIKREFKLQLPCPTPDAKGAVVAFSNLTRQAADRIQAWLTMLN